MFFPKIYSRYVGTNNSFATQSAELSRKSKGCGFDPLMANIICCKVPVAIPSSVYRRGLVCHLQRPG